MFYGMPIHIIRDVAMTIRSFYKRINDFIRYRQATRDMNARYADATADEISREDVCIICREDMIPWRSQGEDTARQPDGARNNTLGLSPVDERLRPKKLPCGHILHFACLRSWLERQQNCPTCRAPVLGTANVGSVSNPNGVDQQARAQPPNHQPQRPNPVRDDAQRPLIRQNVFNLGPFRLVFGRQAFGQPINDPRPPNQQGPAPAPIDIQHVDNTFGLFRQGPTANPPVVANFTPTNIQLQLDQLEQQLTRDIDNLRVQADQLFLIRALQSELTRLRSLQANPGVSSSSVHSGTNQDQRLHGVHPLPATQILGFTQPQQRQDSGDQDLPDGMRLPDGWSILPLRRVPTAAAGPANTLQRPDVNVQRTVDEVLLRSISPSTANVSGVNQLNESPSRTLGDVNGTASPNHAMELPPGPDGRAATTRSWVGDDVGQANRDGPLNQQKHADEEPRAISADQASPPPPASQPSIPMWASSAGVADQDQESRIGEEAIPASSIGGRSRSSGAVEDLDEAAESSQGPGQGEGKGKGKAATVEDYVEEVD